MRVELFGVGCRYVLAGGLLAGLGAVAAAQGDALEGARALLAAGQVGQADEAVRAVLAREPGSADAHYLLGEVLFREQKARESLAEMTAGARGRRPTAAEFVTVARDYVLLKDLPDAEKWLEASLAESAGDAETWYLLGRTRYNEGKNEGAVEAFGRCLALRPRDVRARYNEGLALERMGKADAAEAAYREAIAWQEGVARQDAQPYLDLGMLLLGQGKTDGAAAALEAAARFGGQNAMVQQELGLAREAQGRLPEAAAALEEASRLAPEAEQPHFFLGRVYRRMGRGEAAKAEYATAQRLLGTRSDRETPNEAGR